ncbi:arginine--tRNA ligase [Vallitalea longa]|uniref:Arginine--tRNA ligase n=1 Tax=Vallitalea longa TaxID=2936439 RepID=A0A9W6DGQ9_9FIRM|nr:arginine--tRNA ligase [Vallitalea longa]GKX30034.1 arginine--tRNA ligase [Vallitalea longa]
MKMIEDLISDILKGAFMRCNYDSVYGKVTLSNRPDLCQFQCNGCLRAAKEYHKSPQVIAEEVMTQLGDVSCFKKLEYVKPGFINISVDDGLILEYINDMANDISFGCEKRGTGTTIVIDYGGANVAKPLHIGHLRPAIIGESIKRIGKFLGYTVLGDVHLGDWGLQIGLIITEMKRRFPDLVYFDSNYEGEYPKEPPFNISELEEIYPMASNISKSDSEYLKEAKKNTYLFQKGHKGYIALWKHILNVSIDDLKKNYDMLNVHFDLWKKESDVQGYIPDIIEDLKNKGVAYISDGALVVDVKKDTDKKEMPPCILVKSDGATLYGTTDLATIYERNKSYDPNEIIYIVDKRQELYFEQIFRCARKSNLVSEGTKLTYLGFGTMNGKDGKPFKTRDGNVMRLENLINELIKIVYDRVKEYDISTKEAKEISRKVGLAALKYGDLSNQLSKDYIFDIERFTSFEGNTGPYILYTVVRIKSILEKYYRIEGDLNDKDVSIISPTGESERKLMLKLTLFNQIVTNSFIEYAPNKICQYIYELSNEFNKFYNNNKIITEKNIKKQRSWIKLIILVKDILVNGLDLLGIEVPDRM